MVRYGRSPAIACSCPVGMVACGDSCGSGSAGLQVGRRGGVEGPDGLREREDLPVHQVLVELVQVEQVRVLRAAGLQQVGGARAQRDGAQPGGVQGAPSPR